MVNSEELIGTTEYLTLYTRCRINRCRYNRVRLNLRLRPMPSEFYLYTPHSLNPGFDSISTNRSNRVLLHLDKEIRTHFLNIAVLNIKTKMVIKSHIHNFKDDSNSCRQRYLYG
jgi:hypothetical protein